MNLVFHLAYPMMREPKTDPIPAPEPATPTVAAPAPMNLAAESMSALGAEVESSWEAWGTKLITFTTCDLDNLVFTWIVAGRMLLTAARVKRGETERRAMAAILTGGRLRASLKTQVRYVANHQFATMIHSRCQDLILITISRPKTFSIKFCNTASDLPQQSVIGDFTLQ